MLKQQLFSVQEHIKQACLKYGRDPAEVTLLPVSKTFPAEVVAEAITAGLQRFGENKAQELKQKAQVLGDQVKWVLIGHLQTNKAKEVAKYADEIQSLDRLALAQTLDHRLQLEGRQIKALIQVKTSREETKSGIAESEALEFLAQLQDFKTISVEGFMTIAENSPDPEIVRDCFRRLRLLAEQARTQSGLALPVLSMGMSADYELAIAEGSTEVRIGTAIFGRRTYPE